METHTSPPAVKGVTAAILIVSFLYAFVNSISSVLLNEVVETFALTGAAQGLLSSMLNVGYMLALLVNPLFQGRTEKLAMLLLSGILQVAMLLLSGAATSFAVFLPAIVLLGVGCGWLDGYINSCMIDYHPQDSPKYLSLLHGLFGVGSLLAPLLMQALLLGISWRGVFFVTGGHDGGGHGLCSPGTAWGQAPERLPAGAGGPPVLAGIGRLPAQQAQSAVTGPAGPCAPWCRPA